MSCINSVQCRPIMISNKRDIIVISGQYQSGKAIGFYKEDTYKDFANEAYTYWDKNIFVNIAKWLTTDKCVNFTECHFSIDQFQNNLNKDYQVILYPQSTMVDIHNKDLIRKLESGSWGILFFGTYFEEILPQQAALMKQYGILPEKGETKIREMEFNLNWCNAEVN